MSISPFRCRHCDGAARAEACHFCPVILFPVTISHDPTEKGSAYTDLRLLITPNTWEKRINVSIPHTTCRERPDVCCSLQSPACVCQEG